MRKIKLTVLMSLIFGFMQAQIVEQKIIKAGVIEDVGIVNIENVGTKYFYFDNSDFTLNLYNTDHSLYKSIQLDITALKLDDYPNFKTPYPFCMTQSLFNDDDKIEFLLHIYAQSADWMSEVYKTVVVNEEGAVIFEKNGYSPAGDFESVQFPDWIKNTDDGTIMILDNMDRDSLIVYSLPGSLPCFTCDIPSENSSIHQSYKSVNAELSFYPNPAQDFVTIEYEIPEGEKFAKVKIYNLSGKNVKSYKVDRTFNNLRIPTNSLNAGTYILNIQSNSFMGKGQKLIIE